MMSTKTAILLLLIFSGLTQAETGKKITVARFSAEDLDGWQDKNFEGQTRYTFTTEGGGSVLRADSRGSASGLVKEIKIDIKKYPYLTWRWKIENRLGPMDEKQKSGDDYAARIYIIVSGGVFF